MSAQTPPLIRCARNVIRGGIWAQDFYLDYVPHKYGVVLQKKVERPAESLIQVGKYALALALSNSIDGGCPGLALALALALDW